MKTLQSINEFKGLDINQMKTIKGGFVQGTNTLAGCYEIVGTDGTHSGVYKSYTSDCNDSSGTTYYGITYGTKAC